MPRRSAAATKRISPQTHEGPKIQSYRQELGGFSRLRVFVVKKWGFCHTLGNLPCRDAPPGRERSLPRRVPQWHGKCVKHSRRDCLVGQRGGKHGTSD